MHVGSYIVIELHSFKVLTGKKPVSLVISNTKTCLLVKTIKGNNTQYYNVYNSITPTFFVTTNSMTNL